MSGTLKFPAEAGTKIPSVKRLLVLHKQGALGMVNNSHPQASIFPPQGFTCPLQWMWVNYPQAVDRMEATEQFGKIVVRVTK